RVMMDVGISDTDSLDEPGNIPEEQEDLESSEPQHCEEANEVDAREFAEGKNICDVTLASTSSLRRTKKSSCGDIIWKQKSLLLNDEQLCFHGNSEYKFEIYAEQEESQVSSDQPDFGITGNTVLRFCKDIPRKQNYRLYHDNNYTSLSLIVYLANEGIHSVGTVRRNRIPNCKLPTDSTLKSQPRDKTKVTWYNRKEKKTEDVDCPNIIREYNRHMGGVDLLDSNMGRYKILLKSRKWYLRTFYHLLDVTVVNAWLLQRRVLQNKRKTESS
ncbi:hypothetical protein ILUMI_27162, partial [Ignelater luminosus]